MVSSKKSSKMPILARRASNWLLGILLMAIALPAFAGDCGCTATFPIEKALEEANVVVAGTAIGIQTNPNKVGFLVTFAVDSSWKRPIEPFATVYTEYETGCGYSFQEGEKYVVFINRGHGSLTTGICQPNTTFSEAGSLLQKLGKGILPGKSPGSENLVFYLTGSVLAGMAFLGFVLLRRRRK